MGNNEKPGNISDNKSNNESNNEIDNLSEKAINETFEIWDCASKLIEFERMVISFDDPSVDSTLSIPLTSSMS